MEEENKGCLKACTIRYKIIKITKCPVCGHETEEEIDSIPYCPTYPCPVYPNPFNPYPPYPNPYPYYTYKWYGKDDSVTGGGTLLYYP